MINGAAMEDEAQKPLAESVVLRRKLTPFDFERMNLPEGFWRAKIYLVPESIRPAIERFLCLLNEHLVAGHGLIFSGGYGVGKTGTAAVIAKEARARGFTVFFTTIWDLRECIRNRVGFDENSLVYDRAREVDLLVLDSLSQDDAKEKLFDARAIEELVASRGARRKTTLITTRMPQRKLVEEFPSLVEATKGFMVTVEVTGPNMREQQREDLEGVILGPR